MKGLHEQIKELYEERCNDVEISEILAISASTVWLWRKRNDLPTVGRTRKVPQKRFDVYSKDMVFLVSGTAFECADVLGIKPGSFYTAARRYKDGLSSRYVIYEVGE